MIKREINVITGEEKIIPLTAEEIEQKNNNEIENQKVVQEELDRENNKTSGKAKLKTGEALTDAEVEALFG